MHVDIRDTKVIVSNRVPFYLKSLRDVEGPTFTPLPLSIIINEPKITLPI